MGSAAETIHSSPPPMSITYLWEVRDFQKYRDNRATLNSKYFKRDQDDTINS